LPVAPDLADVLGQGGCGPPGTGKTMLAQGMVGLLPALTGTETLEVTAVHSVAGCSPRAPR